VGGATEKRPKNSKPITLLTLFWAGRGKFAPPYRFFLNKCQTTKGLDLESPDFE